MDYEKQKADCAGYAQNNGGTVADVLRTSGRKGAAVISKDGRILYDPFVMEPEEGIRNRARGEITAEVEAPKHAQKKKSGARKK